MKMLGVIFGATLISLIASVAASQNLGIVNEAAILHGGGPYTGPSPSGYSDLAQQISSLEGGLIKTSGVAASSHLARLRQIRAEMLFLAQRNHGTLDGPGRSLIIRKINFFSKFVLNQPQ